MTTRIEDEKRYPNISKQQTRILDFMNTYIKNNGYPPTVREICKAVELSSTSTVHAHLKKLEKEGYIKKSESKPRAIGIIPQNENMKNDSHEEDENDDEYTRKLLQNTMRIPVVGNVAAGTPILAEENIEEYLSMPSEIFKDGNYFMLIVRGDSMINAGILDKDYVVVRSQSDANNGEIVIARLDDSATVKRFYREKNYIRLQPENDYMSPILVENIEIHGVVKGVFRRFK